MRNGELDAWSDRAEGVLIHCDLPAPDTARLLQDTYMVLRTAPVAVDGSHDPAISQSNLQSLLDAGAFESAALHLAAKCGWMMSRSWDDHVIATVVLPQSEREYSFNARTVPVALCGALVTSLRAGVSERP